MTYTVSFHTNRSKKWVVVLRNLDTLDEALQVAHDKVTQIMDSNEAVSIRIEAVRT